MSPTPLQGSEFADGAVRCVDACLSSSGQNLLATPLYRDLHVCVYIYTHSSFCKLEVLFVDVLITRAILVAVYIKAPDSADQKASKGLHAVAFR